jgi:DNA-binding beta-propeller fold protein YncE
MREPGSGFDPGLVALMLAVATGLAGPLSLAVPADSLTGTSAAALDTLPALALEPFIPAAGGVQDLLIEPSGFAADGFGRWFVSDRARHRLARFDTAGSVLGTSGGLGSERGELRQPGSVALLGTLSVAVLDLENRRIAQYDLFDRFRGILVDLRAPAVEEAFGRVEPVAMACDRGGGIYVADAEGDRILVFDFSGRPSREIGGFGPQPGLFRGLSGVAITRNGILVTVERVNRRVQLLAADGAPLGGFDLPAVGQGGDLAVAVDDSLRIAVCDEGAGALWLFGRGGRCLGAATGLDRPRAVAFDPRGRVVVAESGSGILRREVPREPKPEGR